MEKLSLKQLNGYLSLNRKQEAESGLEPSLGLGIFPLIGENKEIISVVFFF